MILISNSRLIPVLDFTSFYNFLISFSMSDAFAFPLLTKKLQCFSEIFASPTAKVWQPDSLINIHAFLPLLFLKVLPPVLIWLG